MLPSHRRAIADILACRTHALGGHLWRCNHCSSEVYSYHSCKNRSCPRCHKDQTERWIAARETELLACPYFHVTVTVPAELREVLRANQRDGYAALMKATAEAIIELARDRRHVGGTVGVMVCCTPGRNSSSTIRMYIASSPVAACPMTVATGIPPATTSWSRLARSQSSCGPR